MTCCFNLFRNPIFCLPLLHLHFHFHLTGLPCAWNIILNVHRTGIPRCPGMYISPMWQHRGRCVKYTHRWSETWIRFPREAFAHAKKGRTTLNRSSSWTHIYISTKGMESEVRMASFIFRNYVPYLSRLQRLAVACACYFGVTSTLKSFMLFA